MPLARWLSAIIAAMPTVKGISFYLGRSPAAKHAKPAQNLMLDDDGYLCQQFHRALLNSQDSVLPPRIMVVIPKLPAVEVKWIWAGQTAGVALWRRRKKIGAVSILLNGIENDWDWGGIALTLNSYDLSAPQNVW